MSAVLGVGTAVGSLGPFGSGLVDFGAQSVEVTAVKVEVAVYYHVLGAESQAEPAAPQLVRWLYAIAPPGVPWSGFEKSPTQASVPPVPGSLRPVAVGGRA